MEKIKIISCKSNLIQKKKINIKIINNISKTSLHMYSKITDYTVDCFYYKISDLIKNIFNCSSSIVRNETKLMFNIKNGKNIKEAINIGIYNKNILQNLEVFIEITKVFIFLFNQKYKKLLLKKTNIIFIILKKNQDSISSIERYREKQIEEVINLKFYEEIKYF